MEAASFLNGMLQYEPTKRFTIGQLYRHEFLNKNIKNFHKLAPYVSLVLCVGSGLFAAQSFNRLDAWTIFCCCGGLLATVQLGYQAIVESICGAINNYINGKKEEK